MNPRLSIGLLGLLLLFLSLVMLAPAGIALLYHEPHTAWAYVASALLTAATGAVLKHLGRTQNTTVHRRDAFIVVAWGWILAGAFGAIPFLLDGATPTYTDAYFETISGFTTTGSTILTNIEATSHGSLFWRSLCHWLGGMGIVVLFVAVFPQLGVGGKLLFRSEVPGPITEGLQPRIKETSATLWKIYFGITAACTLALWACGMGVFDAINHAMATLATGGYSTKNGSVGQFNSVSVDLVTTLFMLLAGVNFSLYYLIARGHLKKAIQDRELWTYLAIILVSVLAVAVGLIATHGGVFNALRYASFQVVSIITTTGFGTDNFNVYPPLGRLLLVMLMFVGACAGSTAGGIKVYRLVVIARAVSRELTRAFRPQLVRAIRVGGFVVPEDTVRGIFAMVALFIFVFGLVSLILAAMGVDIVTATTATIACLGNIGPGLARVGSIENFAFLPAAAKWFLSACMILGRLEIVTVAALLVPSFWRR